MFLFALLGGLFFPLVSLAVGHYEVYEEVIEGKREVRDVCYEGLVPCGKEVLVCPDSNKKCWDKKTGRCEGATLTKKPLHCQICHFFVMIDDIIDYVILKIVPPLAVLMLVIGGVMLYFGGAKPELIGRAKTLFRHN